MDTKTVDLKKLVFSRFTIYITSGGQAAAEKCKER